MSLRVTNSVSKAPGRRERESTEVRRSTGIEYVRLGAHTAFYQPPANTQHVCWSTVAYKTANRVYRIPYTVYRYVGTRRKSTRVLSEYNNRTRVPLPAAARRAKTLVESVRKTRNPTTTTKRSTPSTCRIQIRKYNADRRVGVTHCCCC